MKTIFKENFYSFEEVAEMLNVSIVTATKMIKEGNMKILKIDHKSHVRESDLRNYLTNTFCVGKEQTPTEDNTE